MSFHLVANHPGLFPLQKIDADTLQRILDVMAILAVTTDELLEICSPIGDHKAPGMESISLKLAVKFRPDMLTMLFEVCITKAIFPTV